ncbi:MAG: virulence RhuM family protein [Akkermansia sp.]|nr:virulence RhuM family protein [Akkermansia sp.]
MRKFGNFEFSTKLLNFYNLDMVISVGYRVRSQRGVQFRLWAAGIIKEFLARIRDIRASEKGGRQLSVIERRRRVKQWHPADEPKAIVPNRAKQCLTTADESHAPASFANDCSANVRACGRALRQSFASERSDATRLRCAQILPHNKLPTTPTYCPSKFSPPPPIAQLSLFNYQQKLNNQHLTCSGCWDGGGQMFSRRVLG